MDRDVVAKAQRGDRDAFAILARTHVDRLYGIANRILRDTGLAEDATQQCLVTLWLELPSLRDPERFVAWATRILVNECNTEARRRSRSIVQLRSVPMEAPGSSDDYLSVVERDEMERAFRRLPPDQRAVAILHHYVGLDHAEIAAALSVAPGTVRSRLYYAHRALRAALEADARSNQHSEGASR